MRLGNKRNYKTDHRRVVNALRWHSKRTLEIKNENGITSNEASKVALAEWDAMNPFDRRKIQNQK